MARKSRIWLPLDVNFMDDTKVLKAGEQAAWLYLAICLFCKRVGVDGLLEEVQIGRLGVPGWQKRLNALLDVELIVRLDDGRYAVASWLEHNDSADELEEKRRKDAARKAKPRTEGGAA